MSGHPVSWKFPGGQARATCPHRGSLWESEARLCPRGQPSGKPRAWQPHHGLRMDRETAWPQERRNSWADSTTDAHDKCKLPNPPTFGEFLIKRIRVEQNGSRLLILLCLQLNTRPSRALRLTPVQAMPEQTQFHGGRLCLNSSPLRAKLERMSLNGRSWKAFRKI